MRILMIHGRAQGSYSEEKLAKIWKNALEIGYANANIDFPKNISIDLPFYGKKLDEIVARQSLTNTTLIKGNRLPKDPEFEQFMQQVIGEIRGKGLFEKEIKSEVISENAADKGIQNWLITRAITRVIDRHLPNVTDFTIESFLKDVFLYVTNQNISGIINDIIMKKVTREPTLVVAHSLGTVIAYKILNNPRYNVNLAGLVTLGSPLGITAISSKLGRARNPTESKGGWYNAYDRQDIVALNPLNHKYFPTNPMIENNSSISNHTHNHHGIVGYLDDALVAENISKKLKNITSNRKSS